MPKQRSYFLFDINIARKSALVLDDETPSAEVLVAVSVPVPFSEGAFDDEGPTKGEWRCACVAADCKELESAVWP